MKLTLSQAKVNDKIVVTDEFILSKLPKLKNKELIVSVIKNSGNRLFCQYFSPDTGSGTLKVTIDPEIKIVGKEDLLLLSQFLKQERYKDKKPKSVSINVNGVVSEYNISDGFWFQNPKNIKLTFLYKSSPLGYSIPGSSIVKSFNY
jgi:hypothetical protein